MMEKKDSARSNSCSRPAKKMKKAGKKQPAFGARRSLAMEPEMKDKVKNVREDFLRDEMIRNELTTLGSDVYVKPKTSVKVIIFSDSRLTIWTPHSSIAAGMINNIMQRKWQQVVNVLFKGEEARSHLQGAIRKAKKQEFKWFCSSNSRKFSEHTRCSATEAAIFVYWTLARAVGIQVMSITDTYHHIKDPPIKSLHHQCAGHPKFSMKSLQSLVSL